jgi:hypothetical protein
MNNKGIKAKKNVLINVFFEFNLIIIKHIKKTI